MSLLDILDFGNDFFGGSSKKQKIKQKEYLSQDVDYYTQGLDNTGIKVSDPGRWSDEDEDGDEKRKKVDISQVGGSDESLTPSEVSNLDESFSGGLSSSSSLLELDGKFVDYNTSLQNAGFKDRSDSFLGRNFGISLAAVPSSAKEVKKEFSLDNVKSTVAKRAIKSGLGMLGLNMPMMNVVGSFITGRTVQDPLGNASYRPDHAVLGAAMDMNFSIQSNNIGQSIAAMNANNLTGYRGAKSSTGFFGYIGGQLVSRGPNGRTYTGTIPAGVNMKDYEALAKGYAPLNYDMGTETGQYSMSVMTGRFKGYDERGYYADVNGFAGSGLMSDVRATAEKYGIKDKGKVITALEKVRSQYTFLGNLKDDVKDVVTLSQALAEVATAESDKKAGIYSTPGSELGDAAGSVGSTGDLGGATSAGYSTPSNVASASSYDDGPGDSSPSGDSGMDSSSDSFDGGGGGWTAKGGFIGKNKNFALGGKGEAEPAGFIGGPPEQFDKQTTIADDIPLTVKDGTFVLNAPAVEYEGSIDVQKMLAEGYQKAMVRDVGNGHSIQTGKIPNREELDIQISRGEVVVPPHVAKAIGYDRLEKINNRGKREVERRQKAGNQEKVQAGQGFAATGGEQNKLDPIKKYLSIADVKKQFKPFGSYKNAKAARVEIARLLKSLPEEDALALAMYSEADVLGEEGLEGVAHVVMNRMRAKDNKGNRYRNFGKDMYNTLLATYEGEGGERIFEFNGLEPSGFRKALKAFTNKEDKYMQVRNIAEDVFKGSRKDFTKNSLYYYNPYTTTSDWYKGQVKTGKFKEVHRTLNPDKKQTKSVHVYHTPIDDYFQELEVNVIPQETPTEKFKPLDDLPQPIRRPNPEPEPDRSGGGGFMFRGVGKNYETEGIISIN